MLEAGPELGKLELKPHTGKTHQLRATCAHLGMPIVGDPLYPQVREGWRGGAMSPLDEPQTDCGDEKTDTAPLQLLAASLDFVDPIDGQHIQVRSERVLQLWPGGHTDVMFR